MLDVGWGDLIDYLGDDPHTRSIVIYMESIGDARSFLSAAREVALTKPIIVIKAGRTEAAAKAAASHTGALTGSDEVLDAAFRRVGVLRVNTIAELFDMAEVLAKQPRPRGPRLAIVTNARRPRRAGHRCADRERRRAAPPLSSETHRWRSNDVLPPHWSHGNPIDILGDADAGALRRGGRDCRRAIRTSTGCSSILTPQAMTDPTQTATGLSRLRQARRQAGAGELDGRRECGGGDGDSRPGGHPDLRLSRHAPRARFAIMWRYTHEPRALYETPALARERGELRPLEAGERDHRRRAQSGRTLLTEAESKAAARRLRHPDRADA